MKDEPGRRAEVPAEVPAAPSAFHLPPSTFTVRLPLLARIIGWFFLNLVLLAAVFWLFIGSGLRLQPLLAGLISERAQRAADSLLAELREHRPAEWDATLARFGAVYGVQFLIIHGDGEPAAGPDLALPETLRAKLHLHGPAPRPGTGPPPGADSADTPSRRRPDGLRPPPGGARREFVHSRNPNRYWLLSDAVLPAGPERAPLRLVIVSETLGAGGLFFDFRPWLGAGSAVLVLSVLWWIPFVRGITRALSQVTAATERIAEGRFDGVVDERRGDELGRLAGAINRMAGRLAHFVTGQKRFLGDVAHELCAPLARMQLAIGVLEQRADPRQLDYVNDVREELQHMSVLVNELLSFSKAGIRGAEVALVAVPLRELVARVLAREAVPPESVHLEVPAELAVPAEPELLARAVGNLVRNAVRHAGQAGPLAIMAESRGGKVELVVADHGPGVPAEALERIFEPFFRVDPSRTRETGGVGLGLAIVKTCVEACGGRVFARNRAPNGLEVVIVLATADAPGPARG